MPSVPSFEGLRLATLEDLPRIATVAAAGFFHSPTFRFQRIHYADYPNDTLSSYWMEYHAAILDPACVVLVAEDALKEDEGEQVYKTLRGAAAYSPGAGPSGVKVLVGVTSINLKPGSTYTGQFQTGCIVGPTLPRDAPENLNRDQCEIALRHYNETTAPAKTRYLAGQMRLSTLAVHPAYWRRGIATRLLGFCTRLADMEGVPVGISAVPMGATMAAKAGFEERELVRVQRLRPHNESTHNGDASIGDVELWVGIRRPTGSPVSDESATSVDSPQ